MNQLTGRMLPVWTLVWPTVMYGVFKYLFGTLVKNVSASIMHINYKYEHQKKVSFFFLILIYYLFKIYSISVTLFYLIAGRIS